MHTRMRERRRWVAWERGRRRMAVLLAVALLAAAVAGVLWLRSSHVFAVERVLLPKTQHVSEDDIRAALGDTSQADLMTVDPEALELKLAAIPYVRTAHVYRRFPHTLEVTVDEYRAAGRIQGVDGRVWLVSDDGRVLEPLRPGTPVLGSEGLLLLKSPEALSLEPGSALPREVAAVLALGPLLKKDAAWWSSHRVHHVELRSSGEATVILGSGLEIRLGDTSQLDQKLMVAKTIIEQYLRKGEAPAYVDVHDPSWAVAKPKGP